MITVAWMLLYPSPSDPKNLQYVLWKAGIPCINLDTAAETMIGDCSASKLVLGKTKAQLQRRFGILLPPGKASDYLQKYGAYSPTGAGKDVMFIRQSPWMVIFINDKATDLILIKGA